MFFFSWTEFSFFVKTRTSMRWSRLGSITLLSIRLSIMVFDRLKCRDLLTWTLTLCNIWTFLSWLRRRMLEKTVFSRSICNIERFVWGIGRIILLNILKVTPIKPQNSSFNYRLLIEKKILSRLFPSISCDLHIIWLELNMGIKAVSPRLLLLLNLR